MTRTTDRPAVLEARRCDWCDEPLPSGSPASRATCSTSCRQARQRFRVGVADPTPASGPMRFAYADPPYPGLARRYYAKHEVDHGELVLNLIRRFPDGWALSTSAQALQLVLSLVPSALEPRVASWHRGVRTGGPARRPHNGWEPLVVVGGRERLLARGENPVDALVFGGRQHSHRGALVGMKPAAFCEWMFRLLGATRDDTLVDLYPGSGAVGRAWRYFVREPDELDARTVRPSRLAGAARLDARR